MEIEEMEFADRSKIPIEYTWAVEDIYESDEEWEKEYTDTKAVTEILTGYKGKLAESSQNLLDFLKKKDMITLKYDRIFSYAERKNHEDTRVAKYQDYYNKALMLLADINRASAFSVPEILSIPAPVMQKFFEQNTELRKYEKHIYKMCKQKEHILSEGEEKLLAAIENLGNAPTNIMATFTNADLKFPSITDDKNNEVPLSLGNYMLYMRSADRRVRHDAFVCLHNKLDEFKNTSAAIYNSYVNQMYVQATARKYRTSMERSLGKNEVPVSVYENLIKSVKSNLHYMHKYIALRKKLLQLEEQHIYDLSISLVQNVESKVSYEEAKEDIVNALVPLGEEYHKILKEGFEGRWIDVYENEGKFTGAYSSGSLPHPYVLLNYKNTLMDEFILVHEMGHAIHTYLSNKHQPRVYSDYTIFVAEVASTCNEALLMEYLLKKVTDKMEKANLINYFLEQFKGTLYRQAMLAEFEMKTHEFVQQGKTLTADVLNEMYYELNCEYYGSEIIVDKEVSIEWSRIPHLYYDFYVYQYATGYSAAMALCRKILDEGQPAVERYLQFLSGGCSDTPIELLKLAGVDMTTPEPINEALQIFGKLIDELEEILNE